MGQGRNEDEKKGEGILCYIKEDIQFLNTSYQDLNMSTQDLEMQWVLLSITNVTDITLVNVYRLPQGHYKKCCTNLLEAFDRTDLKENADIFLFGDFIIDLNDKKAPMSRNFFSPPKF